jgi:hypothetical protein
VYVCVYKQFIYTSTIVYSYTAYYTCFVPPYNTLHIYIYISKSWSNVSLAGPSYEARMMSVQMMEQLKATARANVTICVFDTGN